MKKALAYLAALSMLILVSACSQEKCGPCNACQKGSKAETWTPLFNGKDLSGWHPEGKAVWTVEKGVLTGVQGPGNTPGDLFTDDTFGDFDLIVSYRVTWPANSGIWFRYQNDKLTYQADILRMPQHEAYSGSIYCPGVLFIAKNSDPKLEHADGWNTMEVQAKGDHVQAWLNGRQVADVHDDKTADGHIGIQVHPGDQFAKMKIEIREMKIRKLD